MSSLLTTKILIFFTTISLFSNTVKAITSENDTSNPLNSPIINPHKTKQLQEFLLLLTVNGQQSDSPSTVLISKEGDFYLLKEDLIRFRLKIPSKSNEIIINDDIYFSIKLILYLRSDYDVQNQKLLIDFPSESFESTELTISKKNFPQSVKSNPGGFLNYDFVRNGTTTSNQTSGFLEQGFFNQYGVGTNTYMLNSTSQNASVTRLETRWQMDSPEKVESLTIGDSSNLPGSWGQGQAKQFFGIQYGTNFGTQPGFVRSNGQTGTGLVVMPSTVDVFVNNALVSQRQIQPGPFSINNIPVISGAGDIQLVVTDPLGRQQIISKPIYASQTLLRTGLSSYSTEFGYLRNNFGITSNDYQDRFASGTFRRGLNDNLTGEIHSEIKPRQAITGIGGDYLFNSVGLLSVYAVESRSQNSKGGMFLLGMQRQGQRWSFSESSQWTSIHFYQLTQSSGDLQPSPSLSSSFNVSYSAGALGYVGLTLIERINRGYENTKLASLSYNVTLSNLFNFSISALRDIQNSNTTLFAQLSIPLSPGINLSSNYQKVNSVDDNRNGNLTTVLQKSLPTDEGYGYQLRSSNQGGNEGDLYLQNNVGTYTLGLSENYGSTATRLQASGAMEYLGNEIYFSRRINQSFAVAHVGDFPNIHVLADNQPVGYTDAKGNVFLPRIRAYDKNIISLDPLDIPFDAKIESTTLEVIPYFRSGLEIDFPITHSISATLQLVLSDGTKVPSGTIIKLMGNNDTFIVGLDGDLYLTGLNAHNHLNANYLTHSCFLDFDFKQTSDPVPFLGSFVCIDNPP